MLENGFDKGVGDDTDFRVGGERSRLVYEDGGVGDDATLKTKGPEVIFEHD